MEQIDSAYEARRRQQTKKKMIRNAVIAVILGILLFLGGFLIAGSLMSAEKETEGGVLRYRYTHIADGEIHTTITGSGTLSAVDSTTFSAAADATVKAVYVSPGETVEKDAVIMELSSASLESQLSDLYADLLKIQTKMTGTTKTKSNLNITAPRKGVVKDLRISEGEAVDASRYLCLISTDGKMKATVKASPSLRQYDAVTVTVGSEQVQGTVLEIKNGNASVIIEDNGYAAGASASVSLADGTELGTAALEVNEAVVVTSTPGVVAEVRVRENEEVKKNAVLFVLKSGAYISTYQSYYAQEQDLLDQISSLEDNLTIKAPWQALVTTVSVAQGDDVSAGDSLCSLSSSEGYQLSLGIDELDVSQVSVGQSATITVDALEGEEFSGTVSNLSYDGSGSYVTTYTAEIRTEPISGAYPGMSASVEILTSSSGASMIVPVNAVQYAGPETFVYLVPDGYDQSNSENVDLNAFEKVSVTTGMSNGSYIVISGDGLKIGDTLCVPTMETTAVFTESSTDMSGFSFGGSGSFGGSQGGFSGSPGSFGGSQGDFPRPDSGNWQRPDGNRG